MSSSSSSNVISSSSCDSIPSPSFSSLSDSSAKEVPLQDLAEIPPQILPDFPGFKIVGDNIDKHVKPRDMRLDAQAKSLNFFNYYAVKSRVDISNLDDSPCLPDFASFEMKTLLPTKEDESILQDNFTIHVSRVLKKYMPFFEKFASGMERHIKHKFYKETSQKSEVVSTASNNHN